MNGKSTHFSADNIPSCSIENYFSMAAGICTEQGTKLCNSLEKSFEGSLDFNIDHDKNKLRIECCHQVKDLKSWDVGDYTRMSSCDSGYDWLDSFVTDEQPSPCSIGASESNGQLKIAVQNLSAREASLCNIVNLICQYFRELEQHRGGLLNGSSQLLTELWYANVISEFRFVSLCVYLRKYSSNITQSTLSYDMSDNSDEISAGSDSNCSNDADDDDDDDVVDEDLIANVNKESGHQRSFDNCSNINEFYSMCFNGLERNEEGDFDKVDSTCVLPVKLHQVPDNKTTVECPLSKGNQSPVSSELVIVNRLSPVGQLISTVNGLEPSGALTKVSESYLGDLETTEINMVIESTQPVVNHTVKSNGLPDDNAPLTINSGNNTGNKTLSVGNSKPLTAGKQSVCKSSFFVCPNDSSSESSSDDDDDKSEGDDEDNEEEDDDSDDDSNDDDDDDDWDSPSTTTAFLIDETDADLACFCRPGLYIPPVSSPAGGSGQAFSSSSPIAPSPTHCALDLPLESNTAGISHHLHYDDNDDDDDIVFVNDNDDDDDGFTEAEREAATERQRKLVEINTRWRQMYPSESSGGGDLEVDCSAACGDQEMDSANVGSDVEVDCATNCEEQKNVWFSSDDLVSHIPVLNESQWLEAYREARIGQWKNMAADRLRFRRRIQTVDSEISWIFSSEHRDQIYRTRFDS